jgi:hypothetical protein
MSDVIWGNVPNGARSGVTIVTQFDGVLDPAYVAARNAVKGVDLDCKDCNTHVPSNTKGGGRGL